MSPADYWIHTILHEASHATVAKVLNVPANPFLIWVEDRLLGGACILEERTKHWALITSAGTVGEYLFFGNTLPSDPDDNDDLHLNHLTAATRIRLTKMALKLLDSNREAWQERIEFLRAQPRVLDYQAMSTKSLRHIKERLAKERENELKTKNDTTR